MSSINMQWLEKGQYSAGIDQLCFSCDSTQLEPQEITFFQDGDVCLRIKCLKCGRSDRHIYEFKHTDEYEVYPCDADDYVEFSQKRVDEI